MSDIALAVLPLGDCVVDVVQGAMASRNWLLPPGGMSINDPLEALPLLLVPPNTLAGGLPPSSSGSAVAELPLPDALAFVWLSARMLARFSAYASAVPPGAGVVWVVVPDCVVDLVVVVLLVVVCGDVDVFGAVEVLVELLGAVGVWVLVVVCVLEVPVDASAATGIAKSSAAQTTALHLAIRIWPPVCPIT